MGEFHVTPRLCALRRVGECCSLGSRSVRYRCSSISGQGCTIHFFNEDMGSIVHRGRTIAERLSCIYDVYIVTCVRDLFHVSDCVHMGRECGKRLANEVGALLRSGSSVPELHFRALLST